VKSRINKAREITDAKISFVSLVDKAANKRQFLITKAEDGQADWTTVGRIVKKDSENHYVTGIVYEPLVEDAHGDFMSEAEITKAAYWFAKNGDDVDVQHSFKSQEGVTVVENWVAKADFKIDNEEIKKGTWLITAEINDDELWDKIEKNEITGFSMGGQGKYSEDDIDLDDLTKAESKESLLSKIAKALGIKTVQKGEVVEIFNEKTKASMFWNAFYTLQECLYTYDWRDDKAYYQTDDSKIREALSDFTNIITDVLTTEKYIAKAISPFAIDNVEKAGKKMSGKNKAKLCGIYDSLGEFLKEFDDPDDDGNTDGDDNTKNEPKNNPDKKEEEEVTKAEAEKLIAEGIEKALAGATQTKTEPVEKADDKLTPEKITEMINEGVTKALEAKQESVSMDDVQKMISEAVAKAVEPIKKQTGLPTNLNGTETVAKQEETHYLHGIL
jgi:hypothetical protein